MEKIFLLAVFCVICTVLSGFLKRYAPEFVMPMIFCASVVVLVCVLADFTQLGERIKVILSEESGNGYMQSLGRITAICFIGQWGSSLCSDAGEKSLAEKFEIAVKVTVLLMCIPYIEKLYEIASVAV